GKNLRQRVLPACLFYLAQDTVLFPAFPRKKSHLCLRHYPDIPYLATNANLTHLRPSSVRKDAHLAIDRDHRSLPLRASFRLPSWPFLLCRLLQLSSCTCGPLRCTRTQAAFPTEELFRPTWNKHSQKTAPNQQYRRPQKPLHVNRTAFPGTTYPSESREKDILGHSLFLLLLLLNKVGTLLCASSNPLPLPYNVAFLTPLVELYSTTQPHSRFFRHTFVIHGIPALFRSLSLHRIHSLALLYLPCSFHSCVADIISDWLKPKQSTVTVKGPTTTAAKNPTCLRPVRTGGNPFRPSHFLTHSRASPPILQSAIPPTYTSGHFTASKQTRKQASAVPSTVAIPRNQHTIFSWYWTPPFSFYRQELLSTTTTTTTTIILTLTSISFLCNVKRQAESRAKALFSSPLERNSSYRVKSGD
ncbi:hypothetical protein CMEL01_06997, partial [Colletotrichum melonis]